MASVEESELCPVLTVTKAGYADCDGEYELTSWRQTHGRFRQVYKHIVKDRYLKSQRTFDNFSQSRRRLQLGPFPG